MSGPRIRAELRRFLRFALLGLVGTAVHYLLLVGLVQGARADPVLASAAGFLAGGVTNYLLARSLAFRSRRPHREAALRFFAVAGLGLAVNSLLMALLTPLLPYLVAQVLTTALLLLWHYGGNAIWTFRERRRPFSAASASVLPPPPPSRP